MEANNGKGLYNNEDICEKAVLLCNDAVKDIISGQYIAFCDGMRQIAQILVNLKTAIKKDRESLEQKVEDLKQANKLLESQLTGLHKEDKDGEQN